MMIDTIVHFYTSLIDLDLDSRSQECKKAKNFCFSYLTVFSINLDGICYTVKTCWCDELHTHFIFLALQIFKGENSTCVILFKIV